jgi:sulfatase maturation enzyme AslB (radical SAM superfamily)
MLGVNDINTDHARPVGRAAPDDYQTRPTDLCGNCGRGRAAVLGNGDVSLCVLGRSLVAGNLRTTPLAQILTGPRWAELVATVPAKDSCASCTPGDSNDCDPSR